MTCYIAFGVLCSCPAPFTVIVYQQHPYSVNFMTSHRVLRKMVLVNFHDLTNSKILPYPRLFLCHWFQSPQHMDSLGENLERSNLYLKLFKLVFGSVTLFAQENELMLKVGVVCVCVCICVKI